MTVNRDSSASKNERIKGSLFDFTYLNIQGMGEPRYLPNNTKFIFERRNNFITLYYIIMRMIVTITHSLALF